MNIVQLFFVFFFSTCAGAAPLFHCSFAKDKWDPNQWIRVKSPHGDYFGNWIQRDMCIENPTPAGASPEELRASQTGQSYTSMVLKEQFSGAVEIASTMEFTYKMAPLIVIASDLGKDKNGRAEYREHYEIVLFDRGINVWHHYYKEGKPSEKLVAFGRFPIEPNTQYKLKVSVSKGTNGKIMAISAGGHEFGYQDESLPDRFYVGITGCEGVNHFYDFTVSSAVPYKR